MPSRPRDITPAEIEDFAAAIQRNTLRRQAVAADTLGPGWLDVVAVAAPGAISRLEVASIAAVDVKVHEGYRVFLRDAEGVETDLGWAPVPATPIADGRYTIRIEGSRWFWPSLRTRVEWPIEIASGVLVAPLPEIVGLSAQVVADQVFVSWSLEATAGAASVADFGVWVSTTEPVDTPSIPDYVVDSRGPGRYAVNVPVTGAAQFIGVACRGFAT